MLLFKLYDQMRPKIKQNEKKYVWRSKGDAFTPKNTLPSSMVVAFFAASGSGTLHKMDLIMVEIWTQFRPIEQ